MTQPVIRRLAGGRETQRGERGKEGKEGERCTSRYKLEGEWWGWREKGGENKEAMGIGEKRKGMKKWDEENALEIDGD